jgi:hypothetical protein
MGPTGSGGAGEEPRDPREAPRGDTDALRWGGSTDWSATVVLGLGGALVTWTAAWAATLPGEPAPRDVLYWIEVLAAGFVAFLGLVGAGERRLRDHARDHTGGGLAWVGCVYVQGLSGVLLALGPVVAVRDLLAVGPMARGPLMALAGLVGLVAVWAGLDRDVLPGFVALVGVPAASVLAVVLTPWLPVSGLTLAGGLALGHLAFDSGRGASMDQERS